MRINFNKNGDRGSEAGSGFTLIELLIGVTIAAMVYGAVFCGVATTFRMLNDSRENLRATQILISRIEGLRLEAWTTNQLFNTSYVPTNFIEYFYPYGLSSTTNEGTYYAGTVSITTNSLGSPSPSYNGSIALITVSVTWTNGVNGITNAHSRSMSTYIAQWGLQNYVYAQ